MTRAEYRTGIRLDAANRKARALPLLVAGHSAADVERLTDGVVTARMISRWVTLGHRGGDPDFVAELERQRADMLASAKAVVAEQRDAGVADAIEVQVYLTRVMRGEITEVRIDAEGNAREVCSLKDRNKAAELLGKAHGLFVERKELDVRSTQIKAVIAFASPDEAIETARALEARRLHRKAG